jgi:hypothetical protein
MKKIKLLLIIIFMTNITNAQNSDKIIGLYNLGASSPEGGSHLFVLDNGKYAITYFGGIQIGTWKITPKNTYKFIPNHTESRFELFGRHNKDLKNHTKISFNGFENSQTFIQLRNEKKEAFTMQQVFNLDANCFSFPYVHTFKTIANNISLMFKNYEEDASPIISFKNPEGYNDFVATFTQVDYYEARPFFAKFKDDKLYFNDDDYSSRKPLDNDGEDVQFIKNFIDKEVNKETIYLNPSYHRFGLPDSNEEGQDVHENHVFNEQKNAFIHTENYVEGEEYHTDEDNAYENMSIIYAYKILKAYTKESVKYKVNEDPLFQVRCK